VRLPRVRVRIGVKNTTRTPAEARMRAEHSIVVVAAGIIAHVC
jgi:hypothetical protein